jgi:hypothetical protein
MIGALARRTFQTNPLQPGIANQMVNPAPLRTRVHLAKAELTKPCATSDSRIVGIKIIKYNGSK